MKIVLKTSIEKILDQTASHFLIFIPIPIETPFPWNFFSLSRTFPSSFLIFFTSLPFFQRLVCACELFFSARTLTFFSDYSYSRRLDYSYLSENKKTKFCFFVLILIHILDFYIALAPIASSNSFETLFPIPQLFKISVRYRRMQNGNFILRTIYLPVGRKKYNFCVSHIRTRLWISAGGKKEVNREVSWVI